MQLAAELELWREQYATQNYDPELLKKVKDLLFDLQSIRYNVI